jgi:hypothetical protein
VDNSLRKVDFTLVHAQSLGDKENFYRLIYWKIPYFDTSLEKAKTPPLARRGF